MKKNNQLQLSYESDGKMGKPKKEKVPKKDPRDFFNTTQGSE